MNARQSVTRMVWLLCLVGGSAFAACPERSLSIAGVTEVSGRETALSISLVGTGNENGLSFSLSFDPARLTYLGQTFGAGAAGTSLFVNTNQVSLGELGLVVAKPAGQSFAAGSNELARVSFLLSSSAATTTVSFADAPLGREVVDAYANVLCANYSDAQVVITPLFPPTILTDPVSQTVQPITNIATNVTFLVTAGGSPPLRYQWRWNGTDLAGASGPSLTLTNVGPSQAGNYDVMVANDGGAVTSQVAVLTLLPALIPPTILSNPRSQLVSTGETVYLTVAASGSLPMNYQWQRNNSNLDQATNALLVLTNIAVAQAGSYRAAVSNSVGSATSQSATLTVSTTLRVVRIVSSAVATAGTVEVPVELVGFGDESAVGFSLNVDPSALSFLGVRLGAGAAGAGLLLNTNRLGAGSIGVALTLQAGQTFASGTNQLVLVRFIAGNVSGPTTLAFGDQPIARELADVLANPRPVSFLDGVVNILATAPSITQDPQSLTVPIFSQAVFQAGVAGSAPLSYHWQWNGAALAGATGSALTLDNVTPSMEGGYRLIVTNAAGSATSAVATLAVPRVVRAGITNGPTGNLVEMPVELLAAGDENAVGFSLDFDPAQMTAAGVAPGGALHGAALNFNTNRPGHVGVVVAQPNNAVFGFGTQEVARIQFLLGQQPGTNVPAWSDVPVTRDLADTNANSLTVQFLPGAVGIQLVPPLVTGAPAAQTVWIGDTVTFDVSVSGSKPMSWQWQKNGADLLGATNATLTITNVGSADGGNYSLRISNAAGLVSSPSALLTVLTARPDLFVNEVSAPATAVAGQTVPVTWKLFNIGNADAPAGWWHTLWLASDTAGDNPQFVAAVAFTNQLPVGQSLSVTGLVALPASLLGDRYFVVQANGSNDIAELNYNNNTAVASASTHITSGDLAFEALNAPATAQAGQTITIAWAVTNLANTPAIGPWQDRLYLGTSPTSLAGAIILLTIQAPVTTLAAGAAYTNTQQVALPSTSQLPAGAYYLTAVADSLNNVTELTRTNNAMTVPIAVTTDYLVSGSNSPPAAGTITGTGYYVSGATNVLTAYPAPGYRFVNWTEGGVVVGTSTNLTTVIYSDHSFVANYAEANVIHVVTTDTSPAGLATVSGAGTYTNGQSANFSAPAGLTNGATRYTFSRFTLNGLYLTGASSFAKTFSTLDVTNISIVAEYTSQNVLPLVVAAFANIANPVGATTNLTLTIRFDRSMATTPQPLLTLTNSMASLQATVPAGGGWSTSALPNDTFNTPPVTLSQGMDGTVQVYVSGAQDSLGDILQLTNVYTISLDATPPTLSSIAATPSVLSALVTWTSDEPASSLVEYGMTTAYDSSSGWNGQLVTGHGVTLYNLSPLTKYHFRVHSRDAAGNETVSADAMFTTLQAPDLQVENLAAVGALISGGSLVISWSDTNSGAGPTYTSWYDQVVVSNVTAGQTLLNTVLYYDAAANGNILSGGSKPRQMNFRLPDGPTGAGTLQISVTANVYNNVLEVNPTNNTATLQQTAALASYPDLQVAALSVTNVVVQSGGMLGIAWQDTNSGAGPVNMSFVDQVTVSNQATAQVLVNTLVGYDVASSGAIGAGQSANRQFVFKLPDGVSGAGSLRITIVTDSGNDVFEYNAGGTAESNNSSSTSVTSALAPYPDLVVTNVVAPASASAGQTVAITWTDFNAGNADATNAWSDQVFLSPTPATGGGQLLGTFTITNSLAVGQSLTFTQMVTLPQFAAGDQWITVKGNASGSFFELNTTNNSAVSAQALNIAATLALALNPVTVSESAGTNAVSATVTRNGATLSPLTVQLNTTSSTNVWLPASVIIPAGQSSATFLISVHDNYVSGPTVVETISGTATGFPQANAALSILQDDAAVLSLTLNTNAVPEDAGPGAVTGIVARNVNLSQAMTVTLASDLPTALLVPGSVVIPAGTVGAMFNLTPVNDNLVGDTRRVHILASATGLSPVSAVVDVLNVNSANLTLQLADDSVAKGAPSPATTGVISRTPVLPTAQNVALSVPDNALVSVPSVVTIPANAASATFNINVGDDNLSTGPQKASILAQALTPTWAIVTNGQGWAKLTILDTHGPSLSLEFAAPSIAKGSNTLATVIRNTQPTNALTISLGASPAAAVTIPATVLIPAGQTSATFAVTGVLDNTQTGPRKITFTASATGYNSGLGTLTVSDIYIPDLVSVYIAGPPSALTEQQVMVSWVVANQGLAGTTGSWYDYVYLASDNLGQSATTVAIVPSPSSLAIGASYTNQATFYLPATPGQYWLEVVADGQGVVTEATRNNNTVFSTQPITIDAAYRAQLTSVMPTVAPSGTPILLTGRTYSPADNSPVANSPATVRVMVYGTRRVYNVVSDASGNFSYTFQPLANEAGDYTAGADYPDISTDSNQVSFALLGMVATPASLDFRLLPNTPQTNQLVLTNASDHTLSGLSVVVPDLQGNLDAQFIFTNTTLPGDGALTVSYVLQSPLTRAAQIKFSATITSAEGAQLTLPATVTVAPLVPQLAANPAYLARGMLVGAQTVVAFDIINTGGAETGDLNVQLPGSLSWITLSSSAAIPSIPPGGKATVTLTLNPPEDLPLTLYTGSLAVANGVTGVNVPFQFRAVSEGKGDLRVTATDDYTYYVAGAPKVTNATVTVRDAITGVVIAQTNSDENGIAYFRSLPEGPYTLDASAPQHNPYRTSPSVTTGTTNDIEAFMPRQLVTYQWTVVPTDVPDHYTVELESVFETEVPVPNVVIDQPQVMLFVWPNEAAQVNLTLRNEGLIAAQNVTFVPPDDPDYIITPLVENVGTIPAQSEVSVPVTVELRAAPATNAVTRASRSKTATAKGADLGTLCSCLKQLNLTVTYTYPCGGNNVGQQRYSAITPLCAPVGVKKCIDNLNKLIGSQNLIGVACNSISALLSCAGVSLDPCVKTAISMACGAALGGVAGAASSGLSSLPACLCKYLPQIPLPTFPPSPPPNLDNITYGGGGGGNFGYYASGFPVITGFSINTDCPKTPSPHSHVVHQIIRGPSPLALDPPVKSKSSTSGGVCAQIRLRIDQDVVLTRTAFTGTLEIDNGGSTNISGIQVDLDFRDATNGVAADKFVTEGPKLTTLTGVDGTGTLAAGASGSAAYTFLPTVDAAPDAPQTFQIGGTLSYTDNGEQVTVPLLSAPITVYPEARLDLIYFQQRDVYGDDPFTPEIEPSEPFALGLLVKNSGAGNAHNFTITSGQPQIVDNEKGLLIDFRIIGTEVGDQPISPSLSASLGDITPGGVKEVTWDLISSLQGRFLSFSATFKHTDDLGHTNTSLINSVSIHQLTHRVRANRATDDDLPDFLVTDYPNPDNLPDTLYLSDGTVAPVNVLTNGTFDGPVGAGHLQVQLTTVVSNGWNYTLLPDPGPGYLLQRVVRSDGKLLELTNNAWTTDRSFPSSSTGAIRENLLHLFDWAGSGAYTLFYHSTNTTAPTVLQLVDVTPFTQSGPVSSIATVFSEPIDTATFSYANVTLTRDGGANLVTASSGITLNLLSNATYAISGLQALTAADGNYQLTLDPLGVQDLWGNAAVTSPITTAWAKGNAPVVVQSLSPVVPNPRNLPVPSITVTFSKPIDATTFDASDISLTLNGTNLPTSILTVAPVSSTTFTINGLGTITGAEGAYVLTVSAVNVQDDSGIAGFGSQSVSWAMITTPPRIVALEQLATNPRNIVVVSLDVTFSEPIDPATFDYHAVTLTRDGGPNLITSDVTVTRLSPATFRIANFNWVQGYAGTYSFTVNAAGLADLAGNPGTGGTNEAWQIILETPPTPTNLFIVPDLGISSTDGLTSTNSVTLFGTVGASNLTVRVWDNTTSDDLGTAAVNGTNFSAALSFTIGGAHELKVTATDVAGNVSVPSFFELFLDLIPPTAIIQQVTSPTYRPVSSILAVFSEPINTNTLSPTNFLVTYNGGSPFTPTLACVSSNTFMLGNLAAYTAPLGTYLVSLNLSGVQDLAGNQSTNEVTMSWVRGTTNLPPVMATITNVIVPPDGTALVQVKASDPNGDFLTYSLAPGVPARTTIVATNGLFRWLPTRAYAETTNSFTVMVTDNGSPPMSATQTFSVIVLDYLELSLGRTNLQGGESASLPVYLASNDGVTNVVFGVQVPENLLTSWTLTPLASELGSATLLDQTTNLVIELQTAAGQSLQATQLVLQLNFLAGTNQPSGFVTLPIVSMTGLKPAGSPYSNYVAHAGWVAVVQDQPLLLGSVSSQLARTLTAYGKPGTNYQLQYKTTLSAPAWQPLFDYTQTNGAVNLELDGANPMIFYRLLQQ